MEEKKLTDEEIVKALYCLKGQYISYIDDDDDKCKLLFVDDILNLIHRLQSENERLKDTISEMRWNINDQKAEIERLKEMCSKSSYKDSWKNKFFKAQEEIERLKEQCDEKVLREIVAQNCILNEENAELQKQVEELKEELKDLGWYKMWHNKHKKEIEDLTLELETYRPTKLSGNGQCKCSKCGTVCWTDWFSRYKGQTLCDKCLKEIMAKEDRQAVKDTAKEIFTRLAKRRNQGIDGGGFFVEYTLRLEDLNWFEEKYGVEVE